MCMARNHREIAAAVLLIFVVCFLSHGEDVELHFIFVLVKSMKWKFGVFEIRSFHS